MTTIFSGELHVDGRFIYLQDARVVQNIDACRLGQSNGLAGAAQREYVVLFTGLTLGPVPLALEVFDTVPPLPDGWEDIVEVSLTVASTDLQLVTFDGTVPIQMPATGSHRLRYCANGIDTAYDKSRMEGDPELDRYLVQLWPAPESADAVIRQGSVRAGEYHAAARAMPVPDGVPAVQRFPTPEDEERTRPAEQSDSRDADIVARLEQLTCGESVPSERLRAVGGRAPRALDAVQRGDPLPPPLDDRSSAWQLLYDPARGTAVTAVIVRRGAAHRRPLDPRRRPGRRAGRGQPDRRPGGDRRGARRVHRTA